MALFQDVSSDKRDVSSVEKVEKIVADWMTAWALDIVKVAGVKVAGWTLSRRPKDLLRALNQGHRTRTGFQNTGGNI